jgi:hypothetical protein
MLVILFGPLLVHSFTPKPMPSMLKPDLYTKAVLTVIAFCLLVLVADKISFITPATAHSPMAPSLAPGAAYGLVPVNKDGSITVKLQADGVMDVRLRGIDESSSLRWEAIRVKSE